MKDLIIIGAGPAGLTAAMYGARAGLKTLVLQTGQSSSQAAFDKIIENYPGFPQGIAGRELMDSFLRQARQFGAIYQEEEVKALYPSEGSNRVETENGTYYSKAVIIATGLKHRQLNVPGERNLAGKGLFYCLPSDGALYHNKKVVVVGGGEGAIEDAILLARHASEVVVIFKEERLQISPLLEEKAKAGRNLRFVAGGIVTAIEGDNQVTAVRYLDMAGRQEKIEKAEGVLVNIGKVPNTAFLGKSVPLNRDGYVLTNAWMATEVPGIYAIGDVRQKAFRQITTAVGDGAEGALAAERYIANL